MKTNSFVSELNFNGINIKLELSKMKFFFFFFSHPEDWKRSVKRVEAILLDGVDSNLVWNFWIKEERKEKLQIKQCSAEHLTNIYDKWNSVIDFPRKILSFEKIWGKKNKKKKEKRISKGNFRSFLLLLFILQSVCTHAGETCLIRSKSLNTPSQCLITVH